MNVGNKFRLLTGALLSLETERQAEDWYNEREGKSGGQVKMKREIERCWGMSVTYRVGVVMLANGKKINDRI